MSIGIVSDEEFLNELAKTKVIHNEIELGRGSVKEVPEILRAVIAESVINGERAKDVADAFGVSTASVSAYKNGATSTASYHKPDAELKKKNDLVRERISNTARSKLLRALSHITDAKLSEAKVRDLAGIAKDMSSVVSNISPVAQVNQTNAQFIFHSYPNKSEAEYDVIDVVQ